MKKLAFNLLAAILIVHTADAQCTVVSDVSGTIHDSSELVFIDYTVEISGGAQFYLSPPFTACDLDYPQVNTAWTGNAAEAGTIVYTFSEPILSVQVFLAGVGLNGSITQESFTFTTDNEAPAVAVDAGSCADWIIEGNMVTSPDVMDGLNSIAIVTSDTPFTTLTIVSSDNNNINGGSFVGLCDSSLIPTSVVGLVETGFSGKLAVYPNPAEDYTVIDLGKIHDQLEIYITDLTGKQLFARSYTSAHLIQLPMPYSAGIYLMHLREGEYTSCKKIVVH